MKPKFLTISITLIAVFLKTGDLKAKNITLTDTEFPDRENSAEFNKGITQEKASTFYVLKDFGANEFMLKESVGITGIEPTTVSLKSQNPIGEVGFNSISNSYYPSPEEEDIFFNGGLGLGSGIFGGLSFFVGAEYMLNDEIGIGGEIAHYSYSEHVSAYWLSYDINWKITTILVRGTYHFLELLDISSSELDLYGGVGIGYAHIKVEAGGYAVDDGSPFTYSLFAGGKYMFTDNLGMVGELGYGAAWFKVGIAYKLDR